MIRFLYLHSRDSSYPVDIDADLCIVLDSRSHVRFEKFLDGLISRGNGALHKGRHLNFAKKNNFTMLQQSEMSFELFPSNLLVI